MKKVYVVFGYTGEYSDRSEWPVCAYLDGSLAEEHAKRAVEEALKIEGKRGSRYSMLSPLNGTNPYDPGMKMDYTGTWYDVVVTELRKAWPAVLP